MRMRIICAIKSRPGSLQRLYSACVEKGRGTHRSDSYRFVMSLHSVFVASTNTRRAAMRGLLSAAAVTSSRTRGGGGTCAGWSFRTRLVFAAALLVMERAAEGEDSMHECTATANSLQCTHTTALHVYDMTQC